MQSLGNWLDRFDVKPLLAIVSAGLIAIAVLGCGSSASSDESSSESTEAISRYRNYLRESGAELSRRLDTLNERVERETGTEGVPGAETTYALARVPYGQIETAAQLYPSLQRKIDGLEEEVPPDEYGGFHEIEKWLFWQEVTTTMGPFAKQLSTDVDELRKQIDSADLQPDQVIVGARRVTDGIVDNVFPGDAERWSHIDLIDAAAKTESVDEAFKAAQPVLAEENPELTKQIEAQLRSAFDELAEYGTIARKSDPSEPLRAGTRFIIYDQVTQDKRWELVKPYKKLAALLAEAEAELGDS